MRAFASAVGVAALSRSRFTSHVTVIILSRLLMTRMVFVASMGGAVVRVIRRGNHLLVRDIPLVFRRHGCSVDGDGRSGHDCKKQRYWSPALSNYRILGEPLF